jgi:hypothetical protein
MHRAVIEAWWPWFGLFAAGVAALLLVVRLAGARFEPARLTRLHADQAGAVQSLSFVLTLPLFMMLMLFIVQVSQLMIAGVVVQYAAYAAARAAIVWIPAQLGDEAPNWIGPSVTQGAGLPAGVIGSPGDSAPGSGAWAPLFYEESRKLEKIAQAAKWACVSISPSRSLGLMASADLADIQELAYRALARDSTIPSGAITNRLRNKLAYAFAAGQTITLWDRDLGSWVTLPASQTTSVAVQHYMRDPTEANEVGWQDPIRVMLTHYLVLLPGPGNMLFRYVSAGQAQGMGSNFGYVVAPRGRFPVFRITGEATLLNEGQKSVVPYVYSPTE